MEMLYQYEHDYRLSDKKFGQAFPNFRKTDFETSVKERA